MAQNGSEWPVDHGEARSNSFDLSNFFDKRIEEVSNSFEQTAHLVHSIKAQA